MRGRPAMFALDSVPGEALLDRVPEPILNDRRMLARIALVLMHDAAAIDWVLQHQIEGTAG